MKGEIVWLSVFDAGGEVDLRRVGAVVEVTPAFEPLEPRLAVPRGVDLPRPLSVRLPPVSAETTLGPRTFEVSARIYAVGAVALMLRTRFEADTFSDLRAMAEPQLLRDGEKEPLGALAGRVFADVMKSVRGALVQEYPVASDPEGYTVFCITEPPEPVSVLLTEHRRALAALVGNEPEPARLGEEEVEDNLRHWFRYYEDDLVVADWDYGLLVEPRGRYEDTLFVMELANVQLLELRTYDAFLDGVLDRASDDLERFYRPGGVFRSARELQRSLSEARMDLIRVLDDIHNIGKIFGDWYLAKLYAGLTDRFHLRDWEHAVATKLGALEDVYNLASHEVEHRRAVLLEGAIVLLFMVDLELLAVLAR